MDACTPGQPSTRSPPSLPPTSQERGLLWSGQVQYMHEVSWHLHLLESVFGQHHVDGKPGNVLFKVTCARFQQKLDESLDELLKVEQQADLAEAQTSLRGEMLVEYWRAYGRLPGRFELADLGNCRDADAGGRGDGTTYT